MAGKKLAILIAVSVGVIAALGTVGVFTKSAFSNGNDGVATSGPLAQQDNTALPSMEPAPCDFDNWVGLSRAEAQARVDETGRPARILPPGSMMTMDYRPDRINVELDDNDIVTRVFCG